MVDLSSLFKNLGNQPSVAQRTPQMQPLSNVNLPQPLSRASLPPLASILHAPSTQGTDPRILGNGAYTAKPNWHTLNPAQRAQVIDGIHEGWYQVDPATGDIHPTKNFQVWKLQDNLDRVRNERVQSMWHAAHPDKWPLQIVGRHGDWRTI